MLRSTYSSSYYGPFLLYKELQYKESQTHELFRPIWRTFDDIYKVTIVPNYKKKQTIMSVSQNQGLHSPFSYIHNLKQEILF